MRTEEQRQARRDEKDLARAKCLDLLETARAVLESGFYDHRLFDAIHELGELSRTFVVTDEDAADTFGLPATELS